MIECWLNLGENVERIVNEREWLQARKECCACYIYLWTYMGIFLTVWFKLYHESKSLVA